MMIRVCIDSWLEKNGFDISEASISNEMYDAIERQAEELAQMAVDEDMDNIGNEIVTMFRLMRDEVDQ